MNLALRIIGLFTAAALLGLFVLARMLGAHWNLLLVTAMIALPLRLLALGLDIRTKRILWPRAWPSDERTSRLLHAAVQSTAPFAGAAAIAFALVPAQLGDDMLLVASVLIGLLVSWVAMAWLQRDTPRWGMTIAAGGIALLFSVDLALALRSPTPEVAPLGPPLAVESMVLQGGSSPLLNHHHSLVQQRHAVDIVVLKNGLFIDGPPEALDSYGCLGVPVLAPAGGTVVRLRDDLPDNAIGETDYENLVGNHVVLQIAPEQHLLLAHLQQDSLLVEEGDIVEAGHALGRCGNSGNTSAPHLHLQVSNLPDFSNDDPDLHTLAAPFAAVARGESVGSLVPRRRDRLLVR
ncbi:MAG: hypothetical protein ACI8S6_005929 [Myxococcota bacterium]|jgi:hypothetical protein